MFSKRNALFGCIAIVATFFVMAVGVLTSLFHSDSQLRSRRSYAAYDFHIDPCREYEDACNDSANSVQDAVDVALRVAGYPSEDGIEPDRVKAFYENASMVTVVIGNDRLMNDSIRAKEVRVDLIRVDGVWKVEWAGARYRCWRCFYQGWITWPCP
jgi:hypothetical protein